MAVEPTLSVVLGTHNRLESLRRCLTSILGQTHTPLRIYVTDAGSNDGTQEYLSSIACETIVPLLRGSRIGQARAYNEVFRMVTTPYVVWLSDDNEIVEQGLDRGVRILDDRRDVGMVGLKVRDQQGPFVKAPYIGGITSAGILNVNQGMLRTGLLQDLGLFSEMFGFYGIDADLTTRVLYAGQAVVMTRAVAIHHHRDWADASTAAGMALKANQDRSLRLYAQKYPRSDKPALVSRAKKKLWEAMRKRLGARMGVNAQTPVFGALPRDWYNSLLARYISPVDPWLSHGREFHLVQRLPWWQVGRLPVVPDADLKDD